MNPDLTGIELSPSDADNLESRLADLKREEKTMEAKCRQAENHIESLESGIEALELENARLEMQIRELRMGLRNVLRMAQFIGLPRIARDILELLNGEVK